MMSLNLSENFWNHSDWQLSQISLFGKKFIQHLILYIIFNIVLFIIMCIYQTNKNNIVRMHINRVC